MFKDRSIKRHLLKSITWRVVGTIDTMLLGWFISGNPMVGVKIGGLEVMTKMVLYFIHERVWYRIPFGIAKKENRIVAQKHLTKQTTTITRTDREKLNGHNSLTFWFTGLPASGKSTIANMLEEKLFEQSIKTCILDGDNTRMGINKDLDFTPEGRAENIRRVAEIARLMNDAGVVVIASLISPLAKDRQMARDIIGKDHFIETYVDTPLQVCIERDPKSLYKKALRGELRNFTGVNAPYEPPVSPEIHLTTDDMPLAECIDKTLNFAYPFLLSEKKSS
jgi:adenylylsulfate kinase